MYVVGRKVEKLIDKVLYKMYIVTKERTDKQKLFVKMTIALNWFGGYVRKITAHILRTRLFQ